MILSNIVNKIKCILKNRYLFNLYMHDMQTYYETSYSEKNEVKDEATLIRLLSHAIEKGMSLPNCRVGFGKDKVKDLIELCESYDGKDIQTIEVAYGVLNAYIKWQDSNGSDTSFIPIDIKEKICNCSLEGGIRTLSKTEIVGFEEIATHRHSLRYFSDISVSKEDIIKAVKLAQTAPSACNRQSIRVYAVTDVEKIAHIMSMHGGIRTMCNPTVIFVIAGDRTLYKGEYERNTVYVDGGIFTMNLLYALDHWGIASCPAIWGNIPSDDTLLSMIVGIPKSQIIVNLIVAGYYPDEQYNVAVSAKRDIDTVLTIL